MAFKAVRFTTQPNQAEFFGTLRKRVSDYFETNKISKHANGEMIFKSIALLLIYLVPFVLILTSAFSSNFMNMVLWGVMGIGMAGLGLSVMHDANHGAYSSNQRINKIVGAVMYLIGGMENPT
jgi:linoleoyl-CoA desaturase